MRKDSLCARAVCLFLASVLSLQPLNAAAAIAAVPVLIPLEVSPSAGVAPVSPTALMTPLAAPALPATSLAPAPLAALSPAPVAVPAPVSAARALEAAAAPSAALAGPHVSADSSKAEAARSFDLSAVRPASDAGAATGAETLALTHLAAAASVSAGMKIPPAIPAAKPRWSARAKSYAPRVMLAAGAGLAAWALHHLGMPPAAAAAPLAFLAGTLGSSNRTPPAPVLARFAARVEEAAASGEILTGEEAEVIGRSLELDSDQVQAAVAALMEKGELGMRDNKVLVRYSFAARAASPSPIAAEREGDAAALAAVKLLNSGSTRDHSNGLAAAAKALALYDQAAVPPPQRREAEILRANLALEHLGDLLRLYQDVVETVKPEGDAYRVRRVKEIGEALDWLKTATYSRGHTPTMRRELHDNLLSILKDVTPRDEKGGQSEETVSAYVETVDLLEKFDPFYFLEGAAAAPPETPEEKLAHAFRDGILESTKPGAPVREALVSSVAGNLALDAAGAKAQLSRMAGDGWIALRDNGTMIRVSVPGRVEGTPAGDRARKAHEAALEGVKLMNSSDPIDHLRAVSRLDAANTLYTELYSDREAPDNLFNEIQVLRGNAALETAGDVLRALAPVLQEHVSGADPFPGTNHVEASAKLQSVNSVLAWLNGAYYEADRSLEMPRETAEAMRNLLKLSSFRDFLKEKIQGDKELVRGVRLMREFAGLNVAQKGQAYQTAAVPNVPETPGGFRSLAANEFENILRFGTDITQQAANGTLAPTIGRKAELRQIVKTLTRVKKNNPLLVGEPGVGKTELINGLARAIAAGEIPKLRGKNIVKLDIAALVAGTTNRGMFEERLKNIIAEAKNSKGRILLFIDEIHMIVKAGDSEGGTTAAQILKDALSDGTLSLIGATTEGKELGLLEKDGALLRRFNLIRLKAPSKADAEAIVEGVKAVYEKKHGVTIPAETVKSAVSLAFRYITDRQMPDSVLDLLDDAAAEVELQADEATAAGKENPSRVVTPDDVAREVSLRTGIPAGKLTADKKAMLKKLPEDLREHLIGQDEAVQEVADAIQAGELGYRNPKQPIGSFVFLGPTGVGKTELARALALVKFGSEKSMVRLDMSEYQEKQSVARLISAPPGYVGYEDGGQLTEPIRRNGYQVVLFDEIEKAHDDVFDVLLQILEDGRLTDGKGRTVDFSNTIIIMTSNIGARLAQAKARKNAIGFGYPGQKTTPAAKSGASRQEQYLGAFKEKYRPEFVNRVGEDRVIVFNDITGKEELGLILDIRLKVLQLQLAEKRMTVALTAAAREAVLEQALTHPEYGARPVQQIVDRKINKALKDAEMDDRTADGDAVLVDWDAAAGAFRADKAIRN